jgi:hypothetical protein
VAKIAVKLGDHSQKIGKDFGKAELVLADANSSQPIPMSEADAFAIASDPVGLASLAFRFTDGDIRSIRGGVTPTFTRATVRTLNWDWEGKPQNILSGEVPFEGLRRVRNLFTATSYPTNAAGSGTSAPTVVLATTYAGRTCTSIEIPSGGNGAAFSLYDATNNGYTLPAAPVLTTRCSFEIAFSRVLSGSESVLVALANGGGQGITLVAGSAAVSTSWQRVALPTDVCTASSLARWRVSPAANLTSSLVVYVREIQLEDVTGQSNQNPSEYVSVGVLSTPYHGAVVDGVKYFTVQNPNTVSSNVVTEGATGAALPTTYAKGYYPDVASVNLCLQSENFGTTWAGVGSPTRVAASDRCGSVVLDTIGDDAAGTLEGYSQAITFTADAVKAVSIFAKAGTSTSTVIRVRDSTAGVDRLNIVLAWSGAVPTATATTGTVLGTDALGNGVYRVRMATTSITAANVNTIFVYPATDAAFAVGGTGTVLAGGVQCENATTCSSYIPTTTATVTRNADQMAITSLGSWFNAAEGTVVVGITQGASPAAFKYWFEIGDGTNNERISGLLDTGPVARLFVADGGGQVVSISGGSVPASTAGKISMTYKANDFESFVNGTRVGTGDQLGALPTVTAFYLYQPGAPTVSQLQGHISSLSYYPRRLENASLARLST